MANYRSQSKNTLIAEIKKRDKAIRLKCFDCMGGAKRKDCDDTDCFLFPFRPWSKKELKPNNLLKK